MMSLTEALLNPRGVALVGASADPAKNTGRPQRFLDAHGYTGKVYLSIRVEMKFKDVLRSNQFLISMDRAIKHLSWCRRSMFWMP